MENQIQPKKSIWRRLKWVLPAVGISTFLLIAFFNDIGGIQTKYNKVFNRRPCQMEGVTSFYRFAQRDNKLYFLSKPINGFLNDLQETGYVWDGASKVIVPNHQDPVCYKGKLKAENPNYFYCNNLGYYAKIPNDPSIPGGNEFIKGRREAHNYLIDLVLSPQTVAGNTQYKVVSCFSSDKEPQM